MSKVGTAEGTIVVGDGERGGEAIEPDGIPEDDSTLGAPIAPCNGISRAGTADEGICEREAKVGVAIGTVAVDEAATDTTKAAFRSFSTSARAAIASASRARFIAESSSRRDMVARRAASANAPASRLLP